MKITLKFVFKGLKTKRKPRKVLYGNKNITTIIVCNFVIFVVYISLCVVFCRRVFMDRARFIDYKGTRIFFIDFSNCPIEEAQGVILAAKPLIRGESEKSVLTLTYTDGGKFDSDIISSLKEFTKGNEPYVKAAAVVGITGLQKIVLDAVSFFSNREFATFDDMEKAKEYLITYA